MDLFYLDLLEHPEGIAFVCEEEECGVSADTTSILMGFRPQVYCRRGCEAFFGLCDNGRKKKVRR